MAKYIKNESGKYQCPICEYGSPIGKSRQAVSAHFNKKHSTPIEEQPTIFEVDVEPKTKPKNKPVWMDSTKDEEVDKPKVGKLPNIPNYSDKKKSPLWYKQQGKILRFAFSGLIDPLVSWWGKGVMADADWKIERKEGDWVNFEHTATQWMEYNNLTIPITPNLMMIGGVFQMYRKPIGFVLSHKDPNRKPNFIIRFRQRRAIKKALKEEQRRMNQE
jgi:hypothetical protein